MEDSAASVDPTDLARASQEYILQEERNRIAREIHDGVSQNLALLMLKMEIISRLADSDPSRVKGELAKVTSILESSIQELRRSIYALRSPNLATLGLLPALKRLARDFTEHTNIEVLVTLPPSLPVSPEAQSALFSVVQERLEAVAKEGVATTMLIELQRSDDRVVVHFQDNGQHSLRLPFEDELTIPVWQSRLKERVQPFGGNVKVLADPSETRVEIVLPGLGDPQPHP